MNKESNLVYLKHSFDGLTKNEAEINLKKYGLNVLTEKNKINPFKILIKQFYDFMVIILIIATAVSMFLGEMTEAITILVIVISNAFLGFLQEFRTEKTLEALRNYTTQKTKVIRTGYLENIDSKFIVPGDVIMLQAGDKVPADGIVFEASNLRINESIITGESVPVDKVSANKKKLIENELEKNSLIFMGTTVTYGKTKVLVQKTGMGTQMGNIASMIQEIREIETPLQKKLSQLGKMIGLICLAICTVVTITGILRGEELFNMLLSGISLAVASIPEGLPAVVTISLALGIQRMLKRNALIRKLPAVETLGCADVICSDKTGTLTENKMTVRQMYSNNKLIDVTGGGNSAIGEFTKNEFPFKISNDKTLTELLEICCICNNSELSYKDNTKSGVLKREKESNKSNDKIEIIGDHTEGALLIVALKAGITKKSSLSKYNIVDELPFDSDRKCMSVLVRNKDGDNYLFVKGAPDIILGKSKSIIRNDNEEVMTNADRKKVEHITESMMSKSLRVLGMAYKKMNYTSKNKLDSSFESELTFVGIVGMIDPPRKEAYEAVKNCKKAGIKTIMITGDHKKTAIQIGKELSIVDDDSSIITGEELEKLDDRELDSIVENISLYARVSPKHKLRVVRALKSRGHIVAMTGDGVNDAPAIKEASIGIAMGINGTDVTREASSMVLLDDNFATILVAVEEGRIIYNNIRKFIRYMLSCNIGEVITMFITTLLGLPIPLLPIQILLVNLVTDGLPALALGFDPPEENIMSKHPRGEKESIFHGGLFKLILFRGLLIGFCSIAVFTTLLWKDSNLILARTGALLTLVLTQLLHAFECKSEEKPLRKINIFNNGWLIVATACSLAMILSVIYVPFLQNIFKAVSLKPSDWLVVLPFVFLGPVFNGMFKKN